MKLNKKMIVYYCLSFLLGMLLSYLLSNNLVEGEEVDKVISFMDLIQKEPPTDCYKCGFTDLQCPLIFDTGDTPGKILTGENFRDIEDLMNKIDESNGKPENDEDNSSSRTLGALFEKEKTLISGISGENISLLKILVTLVQSSILTMDTLNDLYNKFKIYDKSNLTCTEYINMMIPCIFFLQEIYKSGDDENSDKPLFFKAYDVMSVSPGRSMRRISPTKIYFLSLLYIKYKSDNKGEPCNNCTNSINDNNVFNTYGNIFERLQTEVDKIFDDFKSLETTINSMNLRSLTTGSNDTNNSICTDDIITQCC